MKKKLIFLFFCISCFLVFFSGVYKNGDSLLDTLGVTSSTMNVTNVSTQTKKTTTIVIDAGHGGYDTGSLAYDGTYEKDLNLEIALQTGAILEEKGYEVIYTRTSDEVSWSSDNLEDLSARVKIAEEANADYYISIHLNASEFDDGASGFEIYLNYEDSTITSIATTLESNLTSIQYTQSRGLKSTDDNPLYVIDKNSVPSMLVELGFITDRNDEAYICSEEGQVTLANALATSIMSHVATS